MTFAATTCTTFYRLHHAAEVFTEVFTIVITLLSLGCPLQAIVVAFGLDERTVAAWLRRAGTQRVHPGRGGLAHRLRRRAAPRRGSAGRVLPPLGAASRKELRAMGMVGAPLERAIDTAGSAALLPAPPISAALRGMGWSADQALIDSAAAARRVPPAALDATAAARPGGHPGVATVRRLISNAPLAAVTVNNTLTLARDKGVHHALEQLPALADPSGRIAR